MRDLYIETTKHWWRTLKTHKKVDTHIHGLEHLVLRFPYCPRQSSDSTHSLLKIPLAFLTEIENNSKIHRNHERLWVAKTDLKKNKAEDITLSDFKICHKAMVNKTVWYWCEDRYPFYFGIVLGLQKSSRGGTDLSFSCAPQPFSVMSRSYIRVHLSQLRNQHWYIIVN